VCQRWGGEREHVQREINAEEEYNRKMKKRNEDTGKGVEGGREYIYMCTWICCHR
jgi:hypothetical protein